MSIVAGEEILIVNNQLTILGTESSISSTTGALVVTFGGVGFKDDVYIQNNLTSGDLNIESTLIIGSGTSSYVLPEEGGADDEILVFTTSNGLVFTQVGGPNQVNTFSFGVNDALLKSTGTLKDTETSGITISGSGDMSNINTLTIDSTSTFGGIVNINSTTSSLSNSTGALTVAGGVGIGENLNIGGNINIDGNSDVYGIFTLGVTGTDYYFPIDKGTINQIMILNTEGGFIFEDETVSSTQVVVSSVFGSDNLMIKTFGVDRDIETTGVSISDTNGILGLATLNVDNTGLIGGTISVTDSTSSTEETSGAIVIQGGFGIGENLNIGNNLKVSGTMKVNNTFKIGTGVTEYTFPTEGILNEILTVSSTGGLIFDIPLSNPNKVESATSFGTDNILVKTDSTGRDTEGTGITVSDTNDVENINRINVINDSTIGGNLVLKPGTSSISNTSGSLIVTGGLGGSENLNIGGNLTSDGNINVNDTIGSTSTNTGAVVIAGGIGIGGDTNIGGTLFVDNITLGTDDINVSSVINSTSNTSGAVIVRGGIGIVGNVNIGGILDIDLEATFNDVITITDVTESIDVNTGALIVDGGMGISKNLFLGGIMNMDSTVESNTTTDGALIVSGGVGIAKNLNIGGDHTNNGPVIIRNDTNSIGTGTGALVIEGGMSITKDLYVSSLFVTDPVVFNSKYFMAVHTGTVGVASTSFVHLTWDTELRKDSDIYLHSANSDNIDVLVTGWYEIIVEMTSKVEAGDGSNRTISSTQLTVNDLPVAGSDSFMYNRTAERGHGTSNITTIQNLTANDRINVEINRSFGTSTVTTVANACRIYLAKI